MALFSKAKKSGTSVLEMQNAAKTLYANLRFMSVDEPIKSLVVTSSVPNEGKSTASVNLAQAIATSGRRVLLVECDMRRRSLASMLGAHAKHGVHAVLSETVQLKDAVLSTSTANFDFLDSEPRIPNPADLIASRRFARLVKAAEEAYDYVIFDTPPVGTFVDAAVLSTLVDATVMVVRPNMVRRDEMMHAYEQLKKAEANVVGVCATFVEGTNSEYYYEYYSKDGKKAKSPSASRAQANRAALPAARGQRSGHAPSAATAPRNTKKAGR